MKKKLWIYLLLIGIVLAAAWFYGGGGSSCLLRKDISEINIPQPSKEQ